MSLKWSTLALTFILGVFLGSWANSVPGPNDKYNLEDVAPMVKPSVVTLFVWSVDEKLISSGSGFFVRSGLVATTRHTLEKPDAHYVTMETNNDEPRLRKVYIADSVVADDRASDLLILKVSPSQNLDQQFVVLGEGYSLGQDIFTIASPHGFMGVISRGIVSGWRFKQAPDFCYTIDASVSYGSSGAPVFNYKGEAIGMISGFITNQEDKHVDNLNFVISASRIAQIISTMEEDFAESENETCYRVGIDEWVDYNVPKNLGIIERIFSGMKNLTRHVWGGVGTENFAPDPLQTFGVSRSMFHDTAINSFTNFPTRAAEKSQKSAL